MSAITLEMTIQEIIESYPDTRQVFVGNGFSQFANDAAVHSVGKFLKLETALKTKSIDAPTFLKLLDEQAGEEALPQNAEVGARLAGLLPCPVRVPLLEVLEDNIRTVERATGKRVEHRLEAASVGAHWIEDSVRAATSADELPDIFVSAGFETFFDDKLFGRFKRAGVFADAGLKTMNKDFAHLGLSDPNGHYGMVSVVPAVFLADKTQLGDLPVPRSWADLLKEEYRQKVALPVGDFDLFNAILAFIYKEYGDEGIVNLSKSMIASMHPATMVKTAQKKAAPEKPAITIMPLFFTKMVGGIASLEVVWPAEGAIISPIFMLVKKDKTEELAPLTEAIASKAVGEILAHRGLFPSLNPEVDNRLPADARFAWIGWDYINNNDMAGIISHANTLFASAAGA